MHVLVVNIVRIFRGTLMTDNYFRFSLDLVGVLV